MNAEHLSVLEDENVILTFRSAPNSRWLAWEKARKDWILEGAA